MGEDPNSLYSFLRGLFFGLEYKDIELFIGFSFWLAFLWITGRKIEDRNLLVGMIYVIYSIIVGIILCLALPNSYKEFSDLKIVLTLVTIFTLFSTIWYLRHFLKTRTQF